MTDDAQSLFPAGDGYVARCGKGRQTGHHVLIDFKPGLLMEPVAVGSMPPVYLESQVTWFLASENIRLRSLLPITQNSFPRYPCPRQRIARCEA